MGGFSLPTWCVTGLALHVVVGLAAETSLREQNANRTVPTGASVTLESNRKEYFLGENVLVHFTLRISGTQSFAVDFGGDYRGATRAQRFEMTATDESGKMADDPDPSRMNFGGFGGSRELKPGDTFTESLPVMRYCDIV